MVSNFRKSSQAWIKKRTLDIHVHFCGFSQHSFIFSLSTWGVISWSKLIFKVPTTTWGVPPGHILTNLIINWLWMAMPTGNGENSQVYGQWTIDDSQNWLFAKRLRRQRVYQHGFSGLSISKIQGTVPPYCDFQNDKDNDIIEMKSWQFTSTEAISVGRAVNQTVLQSHILISLG